MGGPNEPGESVNSPDWRLLELIGDAIDPLEIEDFRRTVIEALRRAIPAEWIGLNDIGPDPESIMVILDPPASTDLFEKFKRYSHQNPLIQRYARTRDGRALRFSDVITSEHLHSLELYQQVYAPMGIEHQIAFTLPHGEDRILGVVLARGEPDFTDAERDLLEAARPFLIQAYRNAISYSNLLADRGSPGASAPAPDIESLVSLGLTARQARVLQLSASGVGERDIATHLQISHRTVQKHLERAYRVLGVHNRTQALAAAWASLESSADERRIHGRTARR